MSVSPRCHLLVLLRSGQSAGRQGSVSAFVTADPGDDAGCFLAGGVGGTILPSAGARTFPQRTVLGLLTAAGRGCWSQLAFPCGLPGLHLGNGALGLLMFKVESGMLWGFCGQVVNKRTRRRRIAGSYYICILYTYMECVWANKTHTLPCPCVNQGRADPRGSHSEEVCAEGQGRWQCGRWATWTYGLGFDCVLVSALTLGFGL